MKDQLQDLIKKCIQDLISKGILIEMPPMLDSIIQRTIVMEIMLPT